MLWSMNPWKKKKKPPLLSSLSFTSPTCPLWLLYTACVSPFKKWTIRKKKYSSTIISWQKKNLVQDLSKFLHKWYWFWKTQKGIGKKFVRYECDRAPNIWEQLMYTNNLCILMEMINDSSCRYFPKSINFIFFCCSTHYYLSCIFFFFHTIHNFKKLRID